MLDELTARLLEDWTALFPATPRPDAIDYIVASGSIEGGTTTFLAFPDGAAQPLFVVKASRDREDAFEVEREAALLESLCALGEFFRRSVPRPVLCEKIGGDPFLVQSVLEGRPMRVEAGRDGLPDATSAEANLRLAVEWLIECHRATWADAHERWTDSAGAVVDEFEAVFEPAGAEREALADVRRGLRQAAGAPVGLCVRHGDFCRHNVLVARRGSAAPIGVIDWTFGRPAGLPLHDLVFFATTYALQVRRPGVGGFDEVFRATFLGDSRYGAVVRRAIDGYLAALGIPTPIGPILFAVALLEEALSGYRRTTRAFARGGLPRLPLMLARAEGRRYEDAPKAELWARFFRLFAESPAAHRR